MEGTDRQKIRPPPYWVGAFLTPLSHPTQASLAIVQEPLLFPTPDLSPPKPASGEVTLVHFVESDSAPRLEQELHSKFADKRLHGEWFELEPDNVAYIKGLGEMGGSEDNAP